MPTEVIRLNRALESFQNVRAVNNLIQGICQRIPAGELTEKEAEGLYVVLEWQSQQMLHAEGVIKTMLGGGSTLTKVA